MGAGPVPIPESPPRRFVVTLWRRNIGLLKNVGPVVVWYGDGSVEPGRQHALYPGEEVTITDTEIFVCAVQDVTGSRSTSRLIEDWGAAVCWREQPAPIAVVRAQQ